MQARCPHCSNVFNTERAGIQFCPNCGQQINLPDPAAAGGVGGTGGAMPPPPPGAPGGPALGPGAGMGTGRGPVPWEERSQRGVVMAFFENTKEMLLRPSEFWARMRPDGSLGDGLFYGWLCYAINGLIGLPFALLMRGINQAQMEETMENLKDLPPDVQRMMEPLMQLASGGGTAGSILVGVVIYPVILIIQSALLHLFCLICGAAKNGFNATVRVSAYSQGPNAAIGWLPFCGPFIGGIWVLVMSVWGIYRVQDTTVGRAVMAVVVLPILFVCCCAGVLVAIIAGAAGAMAGAQ